MLRKRRKKTHTPDPNLPYGVRPAKIGIGRTPAIGYVAYCQQCEWSTAICVGNSDDEGYDRANKHLQTHLHSPLHQWPGLSPKLN
jgi:hypothetical protein